MVVYLHSFIWKFNLLKGRYNEQAYLLFISFYYLLLFLNQLSAADAEKPTEVIASQEYPRC